MATGNIPGDFIHKNSDHGICMRLDVTMAELAVKLDPKIYYPYIIMDNGKPILYNKLNKSINVTLQKALLFCRNISESSK